MKFSLNKKKLIYHNLFGWCCVGKSVCWGSVHQVYEMHLNVYVTLCYYTVYHHRNGFIFKVSTFFPHFFHKNDNSPNSSNNSNSNTYSSSSSSNISFFCLRCMRTQQSRPAALASLRAPFCDDWIMYSLKVHLYSSPNRLSGHKPARTASELLQAGPPEIFSEAVFSGSYCKWKHLAPTINYPPDWCHTAQTPS